MTRAMANEDPETTRRVRARQRVMGQTLRNLYEHIIGEPVPDEFLALLVEIDVLREASRVA
jgi:hypothetical protein